MKSGYQAMSLEQRYKTDAEFRKDVSAHEEELESDPGQAWLDKQDRRANAAHRKALCQ